MAGELIRREIPDDELSVPQLIARMEKLRDVMRGAMKEGEDYGVIPGTKSKPTLLKPGAEKLGAMYRYAPRFLETIIELPGGHREYRETCKLHHISTDAFVGEASAVCSTMESKYRYRGGARKCPKCGKETIKKSKFPPRDAPKGTEPGFYCFAKVGGCGANFAADDAEITSQSEVKTENPDIADSYNTVQQIAQKRAYVAAIKTATASSELFTQDLEDAVDDHRGEEPQVPPHDDTHRPTPAPPAKPKPQLSEEFVKLRDSLYRMMRIPESSRGTADKSVIDAANAVVGLMVEGATLSRCVSDDDLVRKVMDELIAKNAVGESVEEIYRDALVKAGIPVPQWVTDALQPVVS